MTTAAATSTKATKAEALSIITKALEQAHDIIKAETGAPVATIMITRALKGARAHFTPYTPWQSGEAKFNEIAFNAEIFAEGAASVLGSLLHEVAHSMNHAEGVEDCSANQYHNRHFSKRAEALGLKTEKVQGKGYARTTLTELGAKRWAKALRIIDNALIITALGVGQAKPKGRNTNLLKAVCRCEQVIRASRGVIDNGVICNTCGTRFMKVGA